MVRQYDCTWNDGRGGVWFKKRKGKQHSVACSTLAETYPALFERATKEGSYKAANQWWADTVRALEADPPTPAEIMQRIAAGDPEPGIAAGEVLRLIENGRLTFDGSPATAVAEYVTKVKAKAGKIGSTIEAGRLKFLATKKAQVSSGKLSLGRYENLRRSCEYFCNWLGDTTPLADITGVTLADYHTHLLEAMAGGKFGDDHAADLIGHCRQLLRWLYEVNLLPALPRNIDSRTLTIKVKAKKIKTYTPAEVKQLLDNCPSDRTRLYVLLAINTGMLQADQTDIRHEQVDWKAGTITRKRTKGEGHENVPTVTFPLWPETLRLLKQEATKGSGEARVLLNEDGAPLKSERLVKDEAGNEKAKKTEAMRSAFNRAAKTSGFDRAGRSFKHLRKTSATLIRSSEWHDLRQVWLGQSPRNIADKHYADDPIERMQKAVKWLAKQYGLKA